MILIPLLYFLILYIVLNRHAKFNVGNYIILIYIISSAFSILAFYNKNLGFEDMELNLMPTIYYCTLITISIIPFYKIRNQEIEFISKPNISYFNVVSYLLIFVFILNLITFFGDLKSVLNSDLKETRDNVYAGTTEIKKSGILYFTAIISAFFSKFSPIVLFFYFYSITFLKKSKLFNILLFTSSFSSVLQGILVAGRTQIVYWILTYILIYLFFARFLSKERKRKLIYPLLIFLPTIAIYLYVLTTSRFNLIDSNQSAYESVISYAGQPYINFCKFYDSYEINSVTFQRIFPFINKYILGNDFVLDDYRYKILHGQSLNIGVFYTFLGDLIVDLGKLGTVIFVLILYSISRILLYRRNTKYFRFNQAFPFLVLAPIPLYGVFYYTYWKVDYSFFIFSSVILYFIFKSRHVNQKT